MHDSYLPFFNSYLQKEIVELSDGDDSEPVSGPEVDDDDEEEDVGEKNGTQKSRTKIKMVFKPKSKGAKGQFDASILFFISFLIIVIKFCHVIVVHVYEAIIIILSSQHSTYK